MPKRRRSGGRAVTSWPSTRMRPRSGDSKPAIRRRAVVLPLPEGPRRARISPFATSSDRPRRTVWTPKLLSSCSRERKATGGISRGRGAVPAHGAVPGGHPLLAVLDDQAPVHVGRRHLLQDLLRPLRQALRRQVGAGREAEGFAGCQLLPFDAAHEFDERFGLFRVLGVLH